MESSGLKLRGIVVGGPISADTDPNSAAPTDQRKAVTPLRGGSGTGAGFQCGALLLDGTTVDLTLWVYQADLGAWFKVNGTVVTAKAKELTVVALNVPSDSVVFLQVTNPVGSPTKLGFFLM